jgi:hypothetical protein
VTILTECPTCDEPVAYGYEGEPEYHGKWGPLKCSACGAVMWLHHVTIGGTTLSTEDFIMTIVAPDDRERMREVAREVAELRQ